MTRRPLIAGNWKSFTRLDSAGVLAAAVQASELADVLLLPPAIYLTQVAAQRRPAVKIGAQNLSATADGAFTGEISGEMLRDVGCSHVLVGHSERRALFAESSELVAIKFERAQQSGLKPILCVGETFEEREMKRTESVVWAQIQAVIMRCGFVALKSAELAYEPRWAIGTGRTATPEQAQAVHSFIRSQLRALDATLADSIRILYGGSVKGSNAGALIQQPDIDGALIGGAALNAEEFNQIIVLASS